MEKFRVAIVVPAFNEAQTIKSQIDKLSKIGDVLIVNDGSTDDTKVICESAECHLLNLEVNCGYDHALETGIKACLHYDFVITTDADGEIPVECVKALKEKLVLGFDCVIGARDKYPRLAEIFVNHIVYKKFGIKDIFCGLKGYRVSEMKNTFTFANSIGTLLAITFLKDRKNFATIPVQVNKRNGESRFGKNDLKTNYRILKVLRHVF